MQQSDSQGFTRTDLIACVATTVVLAALAASGLSSTKDNVNRMVCGRNMRQLALAEGMYACDNQDYLPYCNWDGGVSADPLPGWLYTLPVPNTLPGAGQTVIPDPFVSPWNTNRATDLAGFSDSAWLSGAYFPYMKSRFAYLCPTDIQSPYWTAEPRGSSGTGRNDKLSSYLMNASACNFGDSGTPATCKISDVWSPDCYLFWEVDENELGPGNPGAFAYNDGGNFPSVPPIGGEGLAPIHGNNGGEIVTVGGNVTFVTLSTFRTKSSQLGAGPGGKGLAWWAPSYASGDFEASGR